MLGEDIPRVSTCELEVDVVAADILNRLEVDGEYEEALRCNLQEVLTKLYFVIEMDVRLMCCMSVQTCNDFDN